MEKVSIWNDKKMPQWWRDAYRLLADGHWSISQEHRPRAELIKSVWQTVAKMECDYKKLKAEK
jgi:hypothetical protein